MNTGSPRRIRRAFAVFVALALGIGGAALAPLSASAATVTVTNANDAGAGSLRDAIANSNAGDTIDFDTAGVFATAVSIPLESQIDIPHTLTIQGPVVSGVRTLTISKAGALADFNQFVVVPGMGVTAIDFTVNDLTMIGVAGKTGRAITASVAQVQHVALNRVDIDSQTTTDFAAALYVFLAVSPDATPVVSIVDSGFDHNSSNAAGALFLDALGDIVISGTSFSHNHSAAQASVAQIAETKGDVTLSGLSVHDNDNGGSGGFYISTVADVTVSDSTFENNRSHGSGAAINILGADSFTSTDVSYLTNAVDGAALGGGAIAAQDITGAVKIERNTFTGNSTGVSGGGAIVLLAPADDQLMPDAGVTILDSTFSNNTATAGDGGALFLPGSTNYLDVENTTFQSNRTLAGNGGAVAIASVPATSSGAQFYQSSLLGNSAANAGASMGGAIYAPIVAQTFSIFSSTFAANKAQAQGNSLRVNQLVGFLQVDSSTFDETGNQTAAISIGSILPDNGMFEASYSTIVGPTAIRIGSNQVADPHAVDTYYSILDGRGAPALDVAGTVDAYWSLFSSPQTAAIIQKGGSRFAIADMKLGALADNGGPTLTRMPQPGSPAIDGGEVGFVPTPSFDQRGTGFPRVIHNIVDIGAVEAPFTLPATGGTINPWIPIGGGILLLLGISAVVFVRRKA